MDYLLSKFIPTYQGQKCSKYIALSILVYFHIFFFPIWAIGMLLIMTFFNPNLFHLIIMNFMFAVHVIVEPIRLWLGYSGNLRERVPELAGSCLFGIFPQCIISYYFIALQPLTGDGFALPFEIALNVFYLVFLVPETLLAYVAAYQIAKIQTSNFFLKLDDTVAFTSSKKKMGTAPKPWLSWSSLESFW